MEPQTEILEALRRVSLASQTGDKNKYLEEAKIREVNKGKEPSDRFYLFHILMVLVGLMQILPIVFFLTANNYWMYKFRNVDLNTIDSSHRTSLQAFFVSWTSVVSSVPMSLTMILSTFYGHKVKTRSRLLVTLFITLLSFVVFTGFVKINTDTWQFGFFCLTMMVIIVINIMGAIFNSSSLVFVSKFPQHYMQFFLYGQGISEVFSAVLQLISLAITPSIETAALIYFLVGTSMMAISFILIFFSKYFAVVQYYMDNSYEDTKRPVYKLSEIFAMLKQIWKLIAICAINGLGMLATHPNITSLVASEHNGNGSPWSDRYFVPCVTYLFYSIGSLLGRYVSRSIRVKRSTGNFWIFLVIARIAILVPLIALCNAQPRHHLPVVFGHDWEYAIFIGVLSITGGAFINVLFLSVKDFASGNEELAYLSMMTFLTIYGAVTSPLGLLVVKML